MIFFKLVGWWLLSILKFLVVPFMMIQTESGQQWHPIEVMSITFAGALAGSAIFYFGSEWLLKRSVKKSKPGKRKFTARNKAIVRMKSRWGLTGLLMIAALLSVPISSILAAKFYRHERFTYLKLVVAFFIWAIALSLLATALKYLGFSF